MTQISAPSSRKLRQQAPTSFVYPTSPTTDEALKYSGQVLASLATSHIVEPPAQESSSKRESRSLEVQLFDARSACKEKTALVAMHLTQDQRAKLFAQLDALLDFDEWETEDQPITIEAFTTFLRLLLFLNPQVRPGLGAGYNGELIAAWKNDDNTLSITCMPQDAIRWIVVVHSGEERESASGIAHVERIKDLIQPYQPEQWFVREEKSETPR